MRLAPGVRVSAYEVLAHLGSGAMGEVWRARDTRLDREVAIKLLPSDFARDAERVRRFEREAKSLGALNHQNVAQIHGVEEFEDTYFLVLELVSGESLEQRLRRGPLSIDEALDAARQIAEGLEAAHEAGLIHRDLKPANVMRSEDGRIKLLDFGLAKPVREGAESRSPASTDSVLSTEAGRLLGTPAYMAPEQARGKPIDRRVDVWAFGCVLYECLTGVRAFAGETLGDVIAAVLEREPDLARLPSATPARVRELLARCLAKDQKLRLRDIGEARIALAEAATSPALVAAAAATPRRRPLAIVGVLLAGCVLGATAARTLWTSSSVVSAPVRRFEIEGVRSTGFSPFALSPDGRWLAWCEESFEAPPVRLRRMDGLDTRTLPGTEGASAPFFSADSRSMAYFARGGGLVRVGLEPGAAPQIIVPGAGRGQGAWGADGTIVFTAGPGLSRVSADGGEVEVLAQADPQQGERLYVRPSFAPDRRWLLFTVELDTGFRVEALELETRARHVVVESGNHAHVLPTGHLVYGNSERRELLVAPLDMRTLRTTGPAVVALAGVAPLFLGTLDYGVASDGTLVYGTQGTVEDDAMLVWFDRAGRRTVLDPTLGRWMQPRLSPDGKRLLVRKGGSPSCSLWLHDLERGVNTRLPLDADCHDAVWARDGKSIVYSASNAASSGVWEFVLDAGTARELVRAPGNHGLLPRSFTPDGRMLALLSLRASETAPDIELFDRADGSARVLRQTKAFEGRPAFSPDGRYLSYSSNETGTGEVYLRPHPGPGEIVRVTPEGGDFQVWSRDGGELFFVKGKQLFAVRVETVPELRVGQPELLFATGARSDLGDDYDVAPDGQRFVAAVSRHSEEQTAFVRVVTNWFDEVRAIGER